MTCSVSEWDLLTVAKRIGALELFVKEHILKDASKDYSCLEFEAERLAELVHDLSQTYCKMFKDGLLQGISLTYDMLGEIGYHIKDTEFMKKHDINELLKSGE